MAEERRAGGDGCIEWRRRSAAMRSAHWTTLAGVLAGVAVCALLAGRALRGGNGSDATTVTLADSSGGAGAALPAGSRFVVHASASGTPALAAAAVPGGAGGRSPSPSALPSVPGASRPRTPTPTSSSPPNVGAACRLPEALRRKYGVRDDSEVWATENGMAAQALMRVKAPRRERVWGADLQLLDSDAGSWWPRVATGEWNPGTFTVEHHYLSAAGVGALVVDVGAWMGATSLFAALHGASVIALEPDYVAYRELLANHAHNDARHGTGSCFAAIDWCVRCDVAAASAPPTRGMRALQPGAASERRARVRAAAQPALPRYLRHRRASTAPAAAALPALATALSRWRRGRAAAPLSSPQESPSCLARFNRCLVWHAPLPRTRPRRCVGPLDGTMHMYGHPGNSGSSLLSTAVSPNEGAVWNVTCATVESLQARLGVDWCSAALLKVEPEGGEALIMDDIVRFLRGCAAKAGARLPPMWLSLHPQFWLPEHRAPLRESLAALAALYPVVLSGGLRPLKGPDVTPQPQPSPLIDDVLTHSSVLFAPEPVASWQWPPLTVPW